MKNPSIPHLSRAERRAQRHARQTQRPPNIHQHPQPDGDARLDPDRQLITAKCQAAGLMLRLRLATEARNRQAERQPARPAFQPEQAPAPFPLFDPVAHFATDFMPSRVADRAPVPQPDARCDVPVEPKLENQQPVDQLNRSVRQAFQPDTASPQATTKLENRQSVDQLAAEARRPKSENPPSVDQLNRSVRQAFQPDTALPNGPQKLEIKKSVDQLHPATSPNTSSSEDPANGN